jgi:hypothetical protein
VQRPWLSVEAHSVPIVDAEGDVGCLLNLVEQTTLAQGVHRARFDEKDIPGPALEAVECGGQGMVGQGVFKCLAIHPRTRALEQGPAIGENHPAFGLATVVYAQNRRRGIVRMDLDAQVIGGVDQLHHQREHAPAKACPHQFGPGLGNQLAQSAASQRALRHHAHAMLVIREVPRLANRPGRQVRAPSLQAPPAPDQGLVRRSKCERCTQVHRWETF